MSAENVMDRYTEGDARNRVHAMTCGPRECGFLCRCWCHGITLHRNGERRADAPPIVPLTSGRDLDGA